MALDLAATDIYHITDVANLAGIIQSGGLVSDVALAAAGGPAVAIGYAHIKRRRMTEYRMPCVGSRFVGEFVPFYYCPRSPMLYTINQGNVPGRPAGCQRTVLHLVSTVQTALSLNKPWAMSDGNAGAGYADFFNDPVRLEVLNWPLIGSNIWAGKTFEKQAEFLVADGFPWSAILEIGCHNDDVAARVRAIMQGRAHQPRVFTNVGWYYA